MKVQHTNTGRVAEVLSQDAKQVRIRFEDGTEQGMLPLTFNRWWKKLDEEPELKLVPMPGAEKLAELKDDDKCGDGTPLAEVGKEILEQAKQKSEAIKAAKIARKKEADRKLKEKEEAVKSVDELMDYIDSVTELFKFTYEVKSRKQRFYKTANSPDMFMVVKYRASVAIYTKTRYIGELAKDLSHTKSGYDVNLKMFKLTSKEKKAIDEIISACADYNKTKKSKKGGK